jgi:hypothetical protein
LVAHGAGICVIALSRVGWVYAFLRRVTDVVRTRVVIVAVDWCRSGLALTVLAEIPDSTGVSIVTFAAHRFVQASRDVVATVQCTIIAICTVHRVSHTFSVDTLVVQRAWALVVATPCDGGVDAAVGWITTVVSTLTAVVAVKRAFQSHTGAIQAGVAQGASVGIIALVAVVDGPIFLVHHSQALQAGIDRMNSAVGLALVLY